MKSDFVQFEFDGELQILDQDEAGARGLGHEPADFSSRSDDGTFFGPDKRLRERRQCSDRREQFRFKHGKVDRRSGNDHRKRGWEWKYTI